MKKSFPLTRVQYGLYAECVNHKGELCYNLPYLYILDGELDSERLCHALETAIKAHPTLLTRIELDDNGEPLQVIDDQESVSVAVQPIDRPNRKDFVAMLRPFNIEGDRLFHLDLFKDDEHHYLLWDCHHIINDGSSLKLFMRDMQAAYRGEPIEPELLPMGEAALEEVDKMASSAHDEDRKWYIESFDCGEVFTTLLPDLDEAEPGEDSTLREMACTADEIDAFCKANGVFKSNLFNTAYAYLLARINNSNEAVCYTAYNGRGDKRLRNTIGMFVRTLPIFCRFDNDTTVLDLLKAGQDQMKGCRNHDAYSFAELTLEQGVQADNLFLYDGELFAQTDICGKPSQTVRVINSWSTTTRFTIKCYIKEGRYYLKAEYGSHLYSKALMEQLLESLEMTVNGMMRQQLLRDIVITSDSQLALLDKFNCNDVPFDKSQTIVSMFNRAAADHPDKTAVVFKDLSYTYAEVADLTDRIAAHLAAQGLGRGDVVSVLIERSQWMPIASLGVLKAGCAYQPLDPTYPAERLNFMMKDAEAKLLIADEALRDIVNEYSGPVLLTRDITALPHSDIKPEGPRPDDLFILLYTSGSTGIPKGCRWVHSNIVAFVNASRRRVNLTESSRMSAYASYGFDACTMEMYGTLCSGATLYIIAEEMRLDLIALNDYFKANGVTHAFMTTQVAYQFATSMENDKLEWLLTGGEKLATLDPPAHFKVLNGYGPTECVVYITSYPVERRMKNIPIGRALDNMHLYVVDSLGQRVPVGAMGELWVSGPQVGMGYLNRPEKQAEVFVDNPFDNDPDHRRVYRTGDIVRYLPDGNIEFVGRRDGQVKIRGFRIELKEVEGVIREFPGIKDVTVQAFDEEGGGKFIAAYVVSDETIDIEAMNAFILDRKPPYMVPAVTMQIDAIPLNQNMKVNKRALPKPEKKVEEAVAEANVPMNVLEQELHDIIADIVGNDTFGVTTNLGYAGLTSISSIKLAVLVNKRYGVQLDSRALAKTGTLQQIENDILSHLLAGGAAVEKVAEPRKQVTETPLSYTQTGVFFECLKNPTSTIYNIPYLLSFPSGTDANRLASAVKQVAEAHPALGVHFEMQGDSVVQTLNGQVPVTVPVTVMSDAQLADYKREFVRPFNLQKPPLYRFEVVETPTGVHLLLDVHHLLFDGGSADLFITQVCQVLEGQSIVAEEYNYLDFVRDQQEAEQGEAFAASKAFFAQALERCEGASEIPADLPGGEQGFIGETVCPIDHEQANAFARNHGITPAHLFFAATAYTVSRFTNNRDVYLCTVSSGRSNLKIADTVGMFVNTLPLGLSIDDISVSQLLARASDAFGQTLANENYPFARIATDYGFKPAIAYAYQVGVLSRYAVGGQPVNQELLELNVPKFKINIKVENRGLVVQFDDSLYSPALAETFGQSIVAVAAAMMAQPEAQVRKLSIISDEQERKLASLRQVATGEAPFKLFHNAVEHWAKEQPNHQCLVACDAAFTYAEFNAAANRVAHSLIAQGVRPGERVALLLPRTSRLIIALMGVLKTGAAYIPCDPDYPADRVKLILEDSAAKLIITPELIERLLDNADEGNPNVPVTPDDLAYLIYTSGSTGRPKGVMLRHAGICNYLYGHPANVFANAVATDATRVLSVTTISFDAALQDIGTALYNGKTLVVATEEQANNPLELSALIERERIDMVSGTPSRWLTWLTSDVFGKAIAHIKIARAGGEKFSQQLLDELRKVTTARIFNCYGPTEITVASNNAELTHAQVITVGRPQLNVKEFIVDQDGNELPVGVVGELYIGGRGVGRGYNNLDEMTRERFVTYHGERVYRSGDYARWLPDGNVVILGRTDNQIKLRGLRIELGEIENVILKVEGVQKVVILIRKIGGKEHLCAYYTASRPIAGEDLKAEIAKSLTQYMVPTAYLQLETMPMTPNGKTDVKALPEPQLTVASAYEAPESEAETAFCNIFADILQMERVGVNDNFFDLGGTSLVVTRVIIEADKAGLHVAYGDVFDNPTPRKLAHLVTGETVASSAGGEGDNIARFDYSAIDSLLAGNTLEAFKQGERQPLGNVLLTGSTGYLGIHILRELLDSDTGTIYCLVRGKTLDKAESRLKTMLFYYFAQSFDDRFADGTLKVVLGDVTQDFDPTLKVDTIFNCAAIVKHFSKGTEIEDVNIGGAQRCVEYCLKTGARLIHISTASTRGLSVNGVPAPNEVFTEQRLYMGQFLGNKYIYSKYMAERLILDAVAKHGLNAKVMRVGNLAARSTDGEFQMNFQTNSFMGRIRIYNMLGCCPFAMRGKRVEFSPINEVSHAIVLLAGAPRACCVFHPFNNHTQLLGDVLSGLSEVTGGIRFVEQDEFDRAMEEAGNDPVKASQMSGLLAYQDMAHGQKASDVARDNDYTTQVLYRLGYDWNPTSWDYVQRMLTAIGTLGFFD